MRYIIITCGKTKLKTKKPVTLDVLYTSRLGKGKIELAKRMVKGETDRVYVFSGLLGLVPLMSKSAWYDSENKLPDKKMVEKQVKAYPMGHDDKIWFVGQKKVFLLLKKFIPNLKNLIPKSKGSGDFTRIVYDMLERGVKTVRKEMLEELKKGEIAA